MHRYGSRARLHSSICQIEYTKPMLQINIPFPVVFILKTLHDANFEGYVVGGAVRDALLERNPIRDWDITTNAQPDQILKLFDESFYDNNFGTVMVAPKHIMEQTQTNTWNFDALDVFDITTYRSESDYTNNRHPDKVEWGTTLEEDISRRDFTINALALSVKDLDTPTSPDKQGWFKHEVELHDFFEGVKDLNAGSIRTVGDPSTRFSEDALRMMRAVRIAATIGFEIEPETLKAIKANSADLEKISKERIRDELFKILSSERPTEGIELLDETNLLRFVIPELLQTKNVKQGGRHKYDVWRHSLESLRECPSTDPLVRLATLLHDIGKPKTMRQQGPRGVTFYGHEVVGAHIGNRIADRLRLSKKQKNLLFTLVRWHMFTYNPEMTDSAIKRFIRRVSLENINHMMNLRIGDRKGGGSKATSWRLRELQQRIGENLYEPMSIKDLKISGTDIMKLLDIKPGPIIGDILEELFELVMDDKLPNELEALSQKAQEISQSRQSDPIAPSEKE